MFERENLDFEKVILSDAGASRKELFAVNGAGQETADSILRYT